MTRSLSLVPSYSSNNVNIEFKFRKFSSLPYAMHDFCVEVQVEPCVNLALVVDTHDSIRHC